MEKQAQQVLENLDDILAATDKAAPVRSKPYELARGLDVREFGRTGKERDRWQEKHWEEAIYHRWAESKDGLHESVPFQSVVSYQVMLRNTNDDRGWGEVDLLGASAEGLPVVIELKSKISEYLLRALTEGVAYSVAIRKAWQCGNLREEWKKRTRSSNVPKTLGVVPVVVAAPSNCWNRWKGCPGEGKRFRASKPALQAIVDLAEKLANRGFPVSFVEVGGGRTSDGKGLPSIECATPVSIA